MALSKCGGYIKDIETDPYVCARVEFGTYRGMRRLLVAGVLR
jgi:hypothetical protein